MTFAREEVIWAAGVFEGEGCVAGSQGRSVLQVRMTDEDVIRRLASALGGKVLGPYQDNRKPKYQDTWWWGTTSHEATQAALAAMWPWLGNRRKEAARELLVARRFDRRRRTA